MATEEINQKNAKMKTESEKKISQAKKTSDAHRRRGRDMNKNKKGVVLKKQ